MKNHGSTGGEPADSVSPAARDTSTGLIEQALPGWQPGIAAFHSFVSFHASNFLGKSRNKK